MRIPLVPWLLGQNVDAPGRILLVQTGSTHLLSRALQVLRKRYPRSAITVLVQKGMRDTLVELDGVQYVDNQGPKPAFIKRLRAQQFDSVFMLYTNEGGFWKLKVLPFALGAKAVYAFNENLDWMKVDLRHLDALSVHLRWRLEGSVKFSGFPDSSLLVEVAKVVGYPAVLAYLVAYERVSSKAAGEADGWRKQVAPARADDDRSRY